jgi:hypothetical protein
MARILDRQKAIELRKQGKTYSEIKRELKISKSTLSGWLSKYPLTEEQLKIIKKRVQINKDITVEKCRLTKQRKKEERLRAIYENEKRKILPLSLKEFFFAGLFLYWGEGNKSAEGGISLSNSDPKMIRFFLFWLRHCLEVPPSKVKIYVHLYSDMDVNYELKYWSKELNIPLSQFTNPYIKKSKKADIDQKGFGHGTCNLIVNDVRKKEKMMADLKVIAESYCQEN